MTDQAKRDKEPQYVRRFASIFSILQRKSKRQSIEKRGTKNELATKPIPENSSLKGKKIYRVGEGRTAPLGDARRYEAGSPKHGIHYLGGKGQTVSSERMSSKSTARLSKFGKWTN